MLKVLARKEETKTRDSQDTISQDTISSHENKKARSPFYHKKYF